MFPFQKRDANRDGDVAQLGERVLCKHEVASSTLVISTMNHSVCLYGSCPAPEEQSDDWYRANLRFMAQPGKL